MAVSFKIARAVIDVATVSPELKLLDAMLTQKLMWGFGVLQNSNPLLHATRTTRPVHRGGRVFPEPVGNHDAADTVLACGGEPFPMSLALHGDRSPVSSATRSCLSQFFVADAM
jgi:hypothetical protein